METKMRELIFKNLNQPRANKRDVSIEEIVQRNGVVSHTMKRSMYFVRDTHHVQSRKELQEWIRDRKKNPSLDRKFFHILRKYNAQSGEDKLICKMRGSFYIISNQEVYNIVFIHAIKIRINKEEK